MKTYIKALGIAFFITSLNAVAATQPMPLYLMAGQSNMQGNLDPALVSSIFKALDANPHNLQSDLEQILAHWYATYQNGYASDAWDPVFGKYESGMLASWRANGLIGPNFLSPMHPVFCTTTTEPAVGLTDNCGNPYGPELMFGHALEHILGGNSSFTMVKVVEGGTTLGQDWLPPSIAPHGKPGPNYLQLASRIQDLKSNPTSIHPQCTGKGNCYWKMFLWFQGENDSFSQPFAAAYQTNLTALVKDVRKAVGNPTLPVVIVQIGYWPSTLPYGPQVMTAQANFVASDPHTILVTTKDLSHYYHFDPASQLVIGYRMALAASQVN